MTKTSDTPQPPDRTSAGTAPLLSIVTATYNAEKYLADLIASVRAARDSGLNWRDIEWIVIDGASTDRTPAMLTEAADIITTSISEPDAGIYDAWNKGVALCRGQWILFVGADDYFVPGGLSRCHAAACRATAEVNLIVSSVQWIDQDTGTVAKTLQRPWNWQEMQKWMTIAHPSTLHRKSLFETFGTFDINFRSAADYDFLLRIGPSVRADHIDTPVAHVRMGGASHQVAALAEAQRVRCKNLPVTRTSASVSYLVAACKYVALRTLRTLHL